MPQKQQSSPSPALSSARASGESPPGNSHGARRPCGNGTGQHRKECAFLRGRFLRETIRCGPAGNQPASCLGISAPGTSRHPRNIRRTVYPRGQSLQTDDCCDSFPAWKSPCEPELFAGLNLRFGGSVRLRPARWTGQNRALTTDVRQLRRWRGAAPRGGYRALAASPRSAARPTGPPPAMLSTLPPWLAAPAARPFLCSRHDQRAAPRPGVRRIQTEVQRAAEAPRALPRRYSRRGK